MKTFARQAHWDDTYATKGEATLSWFQENSAISLDLIKGEARGADAAIIDVGGGCSRLVDALLGLGVRRLAVLDISAKALEKSKARLGTRGEAVDWICSDVTGWTPPCGYWLWHDRAVFHFLTEARDREAYIATLRRAVLPGGRVIIASFALDGPEKCSGLAVCRYSHASLSQELGAGFKFLRGVMEDHRTPSGAIQKFQYALFARTD